MDYISGILMFTCANCGHFAMACPECVVTVAIDPETGIPPDVELRNGEAVHITPTPEARERSRQHEICDNCVSALIKDGDTKLMTSADRHRQYHF